MKKIFFLTAICAALTACGGGSGGDNGGSPAPSPAPTPTASCTLPTVSASTVYYGMTAGGDYGRWTFTQSGSALTVANSGYAASTGNGTNGAPFNGTFSANASSNNCAYISTTSGVSGIATAFTSAADIAISAAQVGNSVKPALLMANPETSIANVADTYYLVNYETEPSGVVSSYRRLIVRNDGTASIARWNTTTNQWDDRGYGLTLSDNLNNGFTVRNAGQIIAQAYFKVSGGNKVMGLAVGDLDATDPQNPVLVQGLMVGSNNTASTTLPPGYYVDNNYDATSTYSNAWTGGLDVSTTTITASGRTFTMQANTPTTGFIGLPVDANQPVDVIVASPLGVFAAVTQHQGTVQNTASSATMTFAVRPQQ